MGDAKTKLPRNPNRISDRIGLRYEDTIDFRSWNGSLQQDSESESGICSPPLWGSSSSSSSPNLYRPRNRNLSPTSRTQAIARGQKELMEIVKNMPESSYELSLKDLVEKSVIERHDFRGESLCSQKRREKENRALITRSRSVDGGGFYLKMFFPLSFGSITTKKKKKKKKKDCKIDSGLNCSSKVSPKPSPLGDGSSKGVDRDWWRKRPSSAGESESGGSRSSGSSSGSSRSNSRHVQGGCWFCISPGRSKNAG